MGNAQSLRNLVNAVPSVPFHKCPALSDSPSGACMLRGSMSHKVSQLGSSGSEGQVPLVDCTLPITCWAKDSTHGCHCILHRSPNFDRKPHTDVLHDVPWNFHCDLLIHVGLSLQSFDPCLSLQCVHSVLDCMSGCVAVALLHWVNVVCQLAVAD